MKTIETKISNLVRTQFPAFYQEEGEDFIAFVSAYYEFLEQNFQLLTLETINNFNVGDILTQGDTTGRLVAIDGNDILVYVDGLDTFRCFNVCATLQLITSSSGGSSYVLKGGTTRRVGAIYLSRNLMQIADIDTTMDIFIGHFKEKYLSNIDFDTESNKRLLVKHSLDLYRAKGTDRAIDLFFRLIYGSSAKVYYPGKDLFKLSDGEWVRPSYIEITEGGSNRAIDLVGKQITGVYSGATAFVEKYIKRKVYNNNVHILYISNLKVNF